MDSQEPEAFAVLFSSLLIQLGFFWFLQIIVWGADVDDEDEESSSMVVKVALLLQKPCGLSDGASCAV